MEVVTCGSSFVDVDAYGGIIAEAELQEKLGNPAVAVTSAPLNESVTETVRSWGNPFSDEYIPSPQDTFTLIDVSDPAFFDPIVDQERVKAVVDHHVGFEEYWQHRIGDRAQIEFIGAACTLVYERWVAAHKLGEMSVLSARTLITGILDNTLDFNASVTTERDHTAYQELMKRADLPTDWSAQYFAECQQAIENDLEKAIKNDYKQMPGTDILPPIIAQLVVWDGGQNTFTGPRRTELRAILNNLGEKWWINIVSIGEKKSYFMAANESEEAKFAKLMNVSFDDGVATAPRLFLRKEILKAAQH